MARVDDRVTYLENQWDNFQLQLGVMQDFLQKQFGSRWVDYAVNRGAYGTETDTAATIQSTRGSNPNYKDLKAVSYKMQAKTYYMEEDEAGDLQGGDEDYGNFEDFDTFENGTYEEEPVTQAEGGSDPLSFVEIVDDSDDRQGAYEDTENYDENDEYSSISNSNDVTNGTNEDQDQDQLENYYMEDDHENQVDGVEGEEQESGEYTDGEVENEYSTDLVILNCRTEPKKEKETIKLPSPPRPTLRPPISTVKTYSRPGAGNHKSPPVQKQQRPSPIQNRFTSTQTATSSSTRTYSKPLTPAAIPKLKMPLILPKPTGQVTKAQAQPKKSSKNSIATSTLQQDNLDSYLDLEIDEGTNSNFSSVMDSLGLGSLVRDPDSEDLREFYDVLEDKSVKCKICDKVLKAGWHKYGRHYRTHTGEKPFSCPYCGESFARKDNMNNHMKSKHENRKRKRPDDPTFDTLEDIQDSNEFPMYSYFKQELC